MLVTLALFVDSWFCLTFLLFVWYLLSWLLFGVCLRILLVWCLDFGFAFCGCSVCFDLHWLVWMGV